MIAKDSQSIEQKKKKETQRMTGGGDTLFMRVPSDPSSLCLSVPKATTTQMHPYKSSIVGRGGFGVVFHYHHPIDGKEYAIKRIRMDSESRRISAFREVQLLSTLHHPRIVRYHTSWIEMSSSEEAEDDSSDRSSNPYETLTNVSFDDSEISSSLMPSTMCYSLCVQMELCTSTLAHYLEQRTTLHRTMELRMQIEISEGLAFLHQQGVVHGDVTPKNVLLTSSGAVKISDFGLAMVYDHPVFVGKRTSSIGVGLYQAPEVSSFSTTLRLDSSADVYSAGILFFEMNSLFTTRMEFILHVQKWKTQTGSLPPFLFLRCLILLMICHQTSDRLAMFRVVEILESFRGSIYPTCQNILHQIVDQLF